MKHLSLLTLFCLISSCSSYIKQMHREFDRTSSSQSAHEKDRFDQYRRNKKRNNVSAFNSINNPYVVPSVKREYRPASKAKKRYRVDDIADSKGDGSLWSGVNGRDNFLFSNDQEKRNGDIVLIQVAGRLKKIITAELKRAFPPPPSSEKKRAKGKTPASEKTAKTAEKSADKEGVGEKIHDRISSVVIEEINKGHVLIRGRKSVLFNNRKRLVEIQALISQRDIQADDTINSNNLIETNVNVIR